MSDPEYPDPYKDKDSIENLSDKEPNPPLMMSSEQPEIEQPIENPVQLDKRNIINDEYIQNPLPSWIWFVALALFISLLWGLFSWYVQFKQEKGSESPFFKVTNRELSLMKWQFPEHLQADLTSTPNFFSELKKEIKYTRGQSSPDAIAQVPSEELFLYHTWNRLLRKEFINRPIDPKEFNDFLTYAEEWLPDNWPGAPKAYDALVKNLTTTKESDLSQQSLNILPLDVRIAFQGWKNYFLEAEKITQQAISVEVVQKFLHSYPHYARNYWRNIVKKHIPNYLLIKEGTAKDQVLPDDELSSFLRMAINNFLQSQGTHDRQKESND